MTILVFVFFLAIAIATGVETYYDTTTAKYFIYNAKWFEWVIFFLFINLINNIFRYKMYKSEKIGSFIFHISFLIIVIGAFITRTVSYEGVMTIREGAASNTLLTSTTYLQIKVDNKVNQYNHDIPLLFSDKLNQAKADMHSKFSSIGLESLVNDHVSIHTAFNFPDEGRPIEISYNGFLPKYFEVDTIVEVENGTDFFHLVTIGEEGRQNNYLGPNNYLEGEGMMITTDTSVTSAIRIFTIDSIDYIQSPYDISYMNMMEQTNGLIPRDSMVPFNPAIRLYNVNGFQFVYKQKLISYAVEQKGEINHPDGLNTLQVKIKDGEFEKIVSLSGETGTYPVFTNIDMNGLTYRLCFGSKQLEMPFAIQLRDFELEKYHGTENPSSYASEVTLVDTLNNERFDHRIFMNNVLDYGGYRFFQSSFDSDEKGTILSVNHDWWGTIVTYIGYLLMGIGMLLSVFMPGSRFRFLMAKAKSTREKREKLMLLIPFLFLVNIGFSQHEKDSLPPYIPIEQTHADKFGHLIMQDFGGRYMPVNTMADQVIRKVHRGTTYNGQNANQVFIGMHTNFAHWFEEEFIYVSGDSTKKLLGTEGKYAAMSDFYNLEAGYKLTDVVKKAQAKSPSKRNVFDKDFIKTDERFNIMRGVVMGYYLRIFPMKGDSSNTWYAPADNSANLHGNDSLFVNGIMTMYILEAHHAQETGDWAQTDTVVDLIKKYQAGAGDKMAMPSESAIGWEVYYNNADIFKTLNYLYLSLGLLLLIVQFIHLFNPKFKVKTINRVGMLLFLGLAAYHAFGLGLRWYLSGHAPWSNGYEAIVFISFITVVAGLLFSRNSKIVLGATGILAWLMLFVAHLNNMDPQISNLVPVLKSYWLMIHVAIITGSYGFLGLSAVLGMINLFIDIFKTKASAKRLGLTQKELRYVSEMVMTTGLFMLTIGTFLGGVWANESWGRYWGWDAKETWALASVLVYTMILHFRFIPGLKSDYTFNFMSFWGYSSIIMTFYGVNFYLSGLHSYATGDPVPIPAWVPVTVSVFALLSFTAYMRRRKFIK
ncbi:MAG: cytochrome c biogenesis protein CcsA [Crocinitomicaceae bacterium]